MMRMRVLASFVFITLAASLAHAQQPPRDTRSVEKAGTASLSGVVVSGEAQPKPLRRARVMLTGSELVAGRTAITGDDGTFAFDALPAGRYTVAAAKEAYVTMTYGARRPATQGTPILLADGQRERVTMALPKGGVITGTVIDPEGQPLAGATVSAARYRLNPFTGERGLVPVGTPTVSTDDRGAYRLYGLPTGSYVVVCQPRPVGAYIGIDMRVLSTAEIQQALADVRGRSNASSGTATAAAAASEPRRTVAFAPIYHPSTAVVAEAATIRLAAGEERSGVDIQVQYVPTAKVEGVVVSPASSPENIPLMLVPSDPGQPGLMVRISRPENDGRFSFNGIPPGQYTVFARPMPLASVAGVPRPQIAAASAVYWGIANVSVQGEDVSGITLALQPGITISGRVVFEGARAPSIDFSKIRVPMPPLQMANGNLPVPSPLVQMDATGRFTIPDVIPGPYRVPGGFSSGNTPGLRTPIAGWWVKSVTAGGEEMLDRPIDVRQSMTDVVVTFSDRATELTGTASDAAGPVGGACFVVVFGADKVTWFANSRRLVAVTPDAAGRFTIRNLPPGDYFAAASCDLAQGEWLDPDVLQGLIPLAVKVTLADGERKVQDLTVR